MGDQDSSPSLSRRTLLTGGIAAALTATAPEPTSWAMMLIGFGAMGAAMRRRRTSLSLSYSFA